MNVVDQYSWSYSIALGEPQSEFYELMKSFLTFPHFEILITFWSYKIKQLLNSDTKRLDFIFGRTAFHFGRRVHSRNLFMPTVSVILRLLIYIIQVLVSFWVDQCLGHGLRVVMCEAFYRSEQVFGVRQNKEIKCYYR